MGSRYTDYARRPAPSEFIWAYLSGYPSRLRESRPLAFLQAFTDDSASEVGDRRLYLAGYFNYASAWALFADAWDEELKAYPSIRYLKTKDAYRLRGEFEGWTSEARDEKLRGLARVIRHFNPASFEFSVSMAEYSGLQGVAPRGLANPRFSCTFGVISGVAKLLAKHGPSVPIDFFFDEQEGVSADMALFLGEMIKHVPADARKLINGNPIYKSDLDFMPLQAADMLAWHLRADHEKRGAHGKMLGLLIPGAHAVSEIPPATIAKWSAQMAQFPNVDKLQTKSQWQKARRAVADAKAAGYIPPHGTHLRNLFFKIKNAMWRRK